MKLGLVAISSMMAVGALGADCFRAFATDGYVRCLSAFPPAADPRVVGLRLARHFAACPPDEFAPPGQAGASMSATFIS